MHAKADICLDWYITSKHAPSVSDYYCSINKAHFIASIRDELEEIDDEVDEGKVSVHEEERDCASERAFPEELHLDVEGEENVIDVER